MQKETTFLNESETADVLTESEAQNTISSADADTSCDMQIPNQNGDNSQDQNQSDEKDLTDFEDLIKGKYKDAFAKKVQSIINKRFKEQKIAENKLATDCKTGEKNIPTHSTAENDASDQNKDATDSTYNSLIEAGVDPETAYRVLHLDEIMDSSMRYGAELAAKQLADSIRKKSARPFESALTQKGYSAKATASTLTPEKRKELAKKALMGEQIGF